MEWKFPAKLDSNYDGDTFKLELDLGFGMRYFVAVRLYGVDTPELRGGTLKTKALAELARDQAAKFVLGAEEVFFHCTLWSGKYGRPAGELICDGKKLSNYLINNRLAVPYGGKSRIEVIEQHEANATYHFNVGHLDL